MVIVILVLLIFILSISIPKFIHKHNYIIYTFAAIIALILSGEEANIVTLGYVPLSFMIIVMYTGVFQKGLIKKRLMTVRAENAIIGIIFLLPHAIGFINFYLDYSQLLSSVVPTIGLLAFILSIPLFITSFRFVRKHFKYKEWKFIHKLAYPFYVLLFAHLAFIDNSRLLFYAIVFGMYFLLKVYDLQKATKKAL
jgi:DMSO/TMAO reductase YedYZ heme-binding membrane subunit